MMRHWIALVWALVATRSTVEGRPMVRHIRSTHEFDRLLEKHATSTGLPVIADFYSDGCGPCRMMAPIFKKLAEEVGQENAVFCKVDTNVLYELSSRYQIRSLPTFVFFLNGRKWDSFSGAGEGQLRQLTQQVVNQSQRENVVLDLESLQQYYQKVEPSKTTADVETVYQKCVEMNKKAKATECVGAAATQLAYRLKKKYGSAPSTRERFTAQDRAPGGEADGGGGGSSSRNSSSSSKTTTTSGTADKPNLHLASKEELEAELQKRLEEEEDEGVEDDEEDWDESTVWTGPGDFPERVVIVGGGPAGMSAAIYAARAGLQPLVICPPMGGQLEGKGVEVENYPGMYNVTGPAVVASMRRQAMLFGAVFESDVVTRIDATRRPLQVATNASSAVIQTHAIIVATGAETKWLGIEGEWTYRGGGVSSCATCDGAVFNGKRVLVVGGGDAAMEDALVLARTSESVTVIHRRDAFRASKVLAQRVLEHPNISVKWNTTVEKIVGKVIQEEGEKDEDDDEAVDLDKEDEEEEGVRVVTGVMLKDVASGEVSRLACDAVFVAIGHTPSTQFLEGVVEFDATHKGYVQTFGQSTRTSVAGIFAAGDVADYTYRQAITSAGSGAAAALDAERYLSEEGLGNEAAEWEAELMAELMADSSFTKSGRGAQANDNDEEQYNVYADVGGRMQGMRESVKGEL